MTELRAGSSEIVWGEMVQLHPLSAPSDDVPDDILGNSLSPRRPMSAYGSKDSARGHLRRFSPSIDRLFDPSRHRNGADMTALANKIHDGPMSLPDLQILNRKRRELGPAQSAQIRESCLPQFALPALDRRTRHVGQANSSPPSSLRPLLLQYCAYGESVALRHSAPILEALILQTGCEERSPRPHH
jgi:hypothetical protein